MADAVGWILQLIRTGVGCNRLTRAFLTGSLGLHIRLSLFETPITDTGCLPSSENEPFWSLPALMKGIASQYTLLGSVQLDPFSPIISKVLIYLPFPRNVLICLISQEHFLFG